MVEYTRFLEGIVHEPTQRRDRGFDLTVADVYEIEGPGRVDFGGGELESADITPHESRKRHSEDDYEWWHLEAGQYLLEYNESLVADGTRFTLQTREELLERGAFHPTLQVSALPRVPLAVGGPGIKIKENARLSTLVATEDYRG